VRKCAAGFLISKQKEKTPMTEQKTNFHDSAAALIVAAAERSGLLRDVAKVLHHYKVGGDVGCLPCAVLVELTENFGE
jgi:hypothetical protein